MTTGDSSGHPHARRSRLAGLRPGPIYVTAAVVGLAVVAGGAFLLLGNRHQDVTTGALEPSASPTAHASAAAVSDGPQPGGKSAAAPRAAGTASRTTGSPAKPPSAESRSSRTPDTASAEGVSSRTVLLPTGNVHLTWAKANLLGQQEQNLAADNGKPVGGARCTQKLKVVGGTPKDIPNMILCWRTSAARSVLAFQVVTSGAPSAATNVKILNEQWAKLG
ncbi:hypothetical protein ODJ79_17310 [Actinoplanes sp. KI2]|uniref:hypothetical protein n=1 Tax=Actinoplanes sp. KI2 TaxID=2983315 RepID=UPI0021D5D496|nr:hypothetical protein [Actinoplanes sp. KI2]MCU7725488.1 hypothetical protein [Actinoplanes sp. KI2]